MIRDIENLVRVSPSFRLPTVNLIRPAVNIGLIGYCLALIPSSKVGRRLVSLTARTVNLPLQNTTRTLTRSYRLKPSFLRRKGFLKVYSLKIDSVLSNFPSNS